MGYIYKITNSCNRMSYVGQTFNLEERWYSHKHKQKSNCRYFKSAFDKYGINNFQFVILCICFDEDMDKYEQHYIDKYNTKVPNGYNLRDGGNGGRHHEETKQKIAAALKGKKIQHVHPWIGRKHTEETKALISEKLKGKKKSSEFCKKMSEVAVKKPVAQFTLDGNLIKQHESCLKVAELLNVNKAQISIACKKQKPFKGYVWKYASVCDTNNI